MQKDSLAICLYQTLPLKEFLQIEACPPGWRMLDVYLIRDDEAVFYIGQSDNAFDRVWQHIRDGFKGRSSVGRFILCNWPAALNFTVELFSSQSSQFVDQDNQLDSAEKHLIERYAPCFNRALNTHPTPLPAKYEPPNVAPKNRRSLRRMILEARHITRAEKKKAWMAKEQI